MTLGRRCTVKVLAGGQNQRRLNSFHHMCVFYEKRLFGSDGVRYRCCALACALFLNERGWYYCFEKLVYQLVGFKAPTLRYALLEKAETDAKAKVMRSCTPTARKRVGQLYVVRRDQSKNTHAGRNETPEEAKTRGHHGQYCNT